MSILHQGRRELLQRYQQTFKLVYIMHEVIAKIFQPNIIDDMPQHR